MSGMKWLIVEIAVCLIIAALLGALIGWALTRWRRGRIVADYQAQLESRERDYRSLQTSHSELEATRQSEHASFRTRFDQLQSERAPIEEELTSTRARLQLLETQSSTREEALETLRRENEKQTLSLQAELDAARTENEHANLRETEVESLRVELDAARQQHELSVSHASASTIDANLAAENEQAASDRERDLRFRIAELEGDLDWQRRRAADLESVTNPDQHLDLFELRHQLQARDAEIERLQVNLQSASTLGSVDHRRKDDVESSDDKPSGRRWSGPVKAAVASGAAYVGARTSGLIGDDEQHDGSGGTWLQKARRKVSQLADGEPDVDGREGD
ncbi:hypothetical protein OAS86_06105, partial [Gammaproteobacteria bacterium]|nr:hypothetical protein [Gammaproteobacteria bacterium]